MERLVDDPDPPIGIVRADAQSMWSWTVGAFAQPIPLSPAFLHPSVRIQGVEAVAPHASIGGRQDVHHDRAREAGKPRRNGVGQTELAPLRDEDAIRRFREHAGVAAEREPVLGKRLLPAAHDVVGAGADRTVGRGRLRANHGGDSQRGQRCRDEPDRHRAAVNIEGAAWVNFQASGQPSVIIPP